MFPGGREMEHWELIGKKQSGLNFAWYGDKYKEAMGSWILSSDWFGSNFAKPLEWNIQPVGPNSSISSLAEISVTGQTFNRF